MSHVCFHRASSDIGLSPELSSEFPEISVENNVTRSFEKEA